jgi:hypothetical protein
MGRVSEEKGAIGESRQYCGLGLGLFEDEDFRIGVFPQSEKILIRGL